MWFLVTLETATSRREIMKPHVTLVNPPYPPNAHQHIPFPQLGMGYLAAVLEKNGYSPVAYFVLPEHCWLDIYYRPMQDGFEAFLKRNGNSEKAQAILNAEKKEIALYEKYKAHYSYGV